MYHVFGVHTESELRKARMRIWRGPGEKAEEHEARVQQAARDAKPKSIAEYAIEATAVEYIRRLEQQGGWEKLSIKVMVLTPPLKRTSNPGRRYVDLAELPMVDMDQQNQLRGLLRGGRFA